MNACAHTYTVAVLGRNEEHYPIAYFDRTTTFEVFKHKTSVKDGAHTCCVNVVSIHEFTQCINISLALNGSSALEHFERSNVIEICNGIMFDFLPRTATHTDSLTTHAV